MALIRSIEFHNKIKVVSECYLITSTLHRVLSKGALLKLPPYTNCHKMENEEIPFDRIIYKPHSKSLQCINVLNSRNWSNFISSKLKLCLNHSNLLENTLNVEVILLDSFMFSSDCVFLLLCTTNSVILYWMLLRLLSSAVLIPRYFIETGSTHKLTQTLNATQRKCQLYIIICVNSVIREQSDCGWLYR